MSTTDPRDSFWGRIICGVQAGASGGYEVIWQASAIATLPTIHEALSFLRAKLPAPDARRVLESAAGSATSEVHPDGSGNYTLWIASYGRFIGTYPTQEDACRAGARSGFIVEVVP